MRPRQARRTVRNSVATTYRPRYSEPKKPLPIRNIVRPIFYLLVISFIFWWIFLSNFFTVKKIDVKGNKSITSREVAKELEELMKSSILGRNIIFLNTNKLASQFAEKNPELGSVKISKRPLNGLNVVVVERQAALIWQSGNKQYILSQDGRAYAEWGGQSSQLAIVTDSANLPIELGQAVVPASFVVFTRELIDQLGQRKIAYDSLSVPQTTNELFVKTKSGYILKFDTTRSIDEQLTDLQAVQKSLAKQKKQPAEYIDLRIAGKVFYK